MTKELACKLLVIGAGPGGYVAAIRAGQLGLDTVIVEAQYNGGTCLNVGCIPSKAMIHAADEFEKATHFANGAAIGISAAKPKLDLAKTVEWKDGIVKRLTGGVGGLLKKAKVKHIKGWAKFIDGKTVTVKVVDANGANPVSSDVGPDGASFDVEGTLTLDDPDDTVGADLTVGTAANITWTKTPTITSTDLFYSKDGSTWTTIATGVTSPYSWTPQDADIGDTMTLKIQDATANHLPTFDTNPNSFSVKGTLTFTTSPSGTLSIGDLEPVVFTNTGDITNFGLYYVLGVTESLITTIERLLSKDPDDRIQTAAEVVAAFQKDQELLQPLLLIKEIVHQEFFGL